MNFTPHSMRAYLVSGASALGAPKESLRWLQGWNMQSGEGYIRTCSIETMRVQEIVGFAAREPLSGEDPFGESPDLKALEEFLLKRGVEPLEAQRVKEALVTFPVDGERLLTWGQRESALLAKKRVREIPESSKTDAVDEQMSGPKATSIIETNSAEKVVVVPEPNEAGDGPIEWKRGESTSIKGYVTSVSGKRKLGRLHFVGLCHRVPGVDYLDFVGHGEVQPQDSLYDDYCHQCWKSGPPQWRGEDSVAIESETSSSGSSLD